MEPSARIIEAEVDLASGIVIERVSEEPPPRRRLGRSVVLVAALAGIASGLAVSRVPSPGPAGRLGSEVVRTGVQVAKLRSDAAPCSRDGRQVLVCGAVPEDVGAGALHE